MQRRCPRHPGKSAQDRVARSSAVAQPGRARVACAFLKAGDAPARRTMSCRLIVLLTFMAVICGPSEALADRKSEQWTLVYELSGTAPRGGWSKAQGHVEFVVAQEPVAVNATGPLTFAGKNAPKSTGNLIIRGSVEDGILTFVPDCALMLHVYGQTVPLDLFEGESAISLPLEDGAERVFETPSPGGATGKVTWRIGGVNPPCELTITRPAEGYREEFSDDKPGKLELDFRAKLTPKKYEPEITWSLPKMEAPTRIVTEPENRRGPRLRVTLTGLPRELSGFGEKEFRARVETEECRASAKRKVKLFFPRSAYNNPGGQKPNWFYYWRQTPAARPKGQAVAIDYGGGAVDMCAREGVAGVHNPRFGYKTVLVCDLLKLKPRRYELRFPLLDRSRELKFLGWRTVQNIDTFAVVVLHEFTHWLAWHNWYSKIPDDQLATLDTDQDGIPNDVEPGLNFDPKMKQTYFSRDETLKNIGNDEEWLAFEMMREHEPGSLDEFDWAHPGNQWP